MSKHDILTESEMSTYRPGQAIVWYLEQYRRQNNLTKQELNILDWGCGRGRTVAYLKALGYNAFGVEVDPEPINNGRPLFFGRGWDGDTSLTLIDGQGKTIFADRFFHVIFSEAVFEHIADIDKVAAEMKRITASNGIGLHLFPAHKHIIEGHLYMPFIHWLPKTNLRRWAIKLFMRSGLNPKWPELQGKSYQEQAQAYFDYSVNQTFYRKPGTLRQIFNKNGFSVNFITVEHPRFNHYPLLNRIFKVKPIQTIVNWILVNFFLVLLLANRRITNN